METKTNLSNDDHKVTQDILTLVGLAVTLKEIKSWSNEKRLKIEKWAGACHLRASDNIIRIPPKPRFKSKPFKYPKSMGPLYSL